MSFFLTTRQARSRAKTVTRRAGWAFLKPGQQVQQIVKGQGLKKGEKVERIHAIQCVSNRREALNAMIKDPVYGKEEAIKEGFLEMTGREFVQFYCRANACTPRQKVNRVEFAYLCDCGQPGAWHTPLGGGHPAFGCAECCAAAQVGKNKTHLA